MQQYHCTAVPLKYTFPHPAFVDILNSLINCLFLLLMFVHSRIQVRVVNSKMCLEFICVNYYYKSKFHKLIKHYFNSRPTVFICRDKCNVVLVFGLSEKVLPNLT